MSEKLHGTLVYKATPEIQNIFLREYKMREYVLKNDETEINIPTISASLRKLLNNHGYVIMNIKRSGYKGKDKVFGCNVKIIKHTRREKILEISIKVSCDTMAEVHKNLKSIMNGVKKTTNIAPQLRAWDKLENC